MCHWEVAQQSYWWKEGNRTQPEKLRAERGSLTCFRKGKRNPKELALQVQSFMYTKDKNPVRNAPRPSGK